MAGRHQQPATAASSNSDQQRPAAASSQQQPAEAASWQQIEARSPGPVRNEKINLKSLFKDFPRRENKFKIVV